MLDQSLPDADALLEAIQDLLTRNGARQLTGPELNEVTLWAYLANTEITHFTIRGGE